MTNPSLSELQQSLHGHLRSSGVVHHLKAQLRAHILGDVARAAKQAAPPTQGTGAVVERVTEALVEARLRRAGLPFTHSVYVSETGAPTCDPEQDEELCRVLGFDEDVAHAPNVDPLSLLISRAVRGSVGAAATASASVQTTDELAFPCAGSLEARLAWVDTTYRHRESAVVAQQRVDLEARLRRHEEEARSAANAEAHRELQAWKDAALGEAVAAVELRFRTEAHRTAIAQQEAQRAAEHAVSVEKAQVAQLRREIDLRALSLEQDRNELMKRAHLQQHQQQRAEDEAAGMREKLQQAMARILALDDESKHATHEAQLLRERDARMHDDRLRHAADLTRALQAKEDELSELRHRLRLVTEEATRRVAEAALQQQQHEQLHAARYMVGMSHLAGQGIDMPRPMDSATYVPAAAPSVRAAPYDKPQALNDDALRAQGVSTEVSPVSAPSPAAARISQRPSRRSSAPQHFVGSPAQGGDSTAGLETTMGSTHGSEASRHAPHHSHTELPAGGESPTVRGVDSPTGAAVTEPPSVVTSAQMAHGALEATSASNEHSTVLADHGTHASAAKEQAALEAARLEAEAEHLRAEQAKVEQAEAEQAKAAQAAQTEAEQVRAEQVRAAQAQEAAQRAREELDRLGVAEEEQRAVVQRTEASDRAGHSVACVGGAAILGAAAVQTEELSAWQHWSWSENNARSKAQREAAKEQEIVYAQPMGLVRDSESDSDGSEVDMYRRSSDDDDGW